MPFLAESVDTARDSDVRIGAQGCSPHRRGAFTGEVAALDIASLGADFIMVGHAERVAAGETLEHFAEQVARARDVGLAVLLCVGESAMGDDSGESLVAQADVALGGVLADEDVVAYEPHWAIGEKGREAPADYVGERLERLRGALGSQATIVYGGSVNTGNCATLAGIPGNSGVFVGRAAWTPEGWDDVESRVKGAMS